MNKIIRNTCSNVLQRHSIKKIIFLENFNKKPSKQVMVLIEKIILRYLDKNKRGKFKASFTKILLSTRIISVQILNILIWWYHQRNTSFCVVLRIVDNHKLNLKTLVVNLHPIYNCYCCEQSRKKITYIFLHVDIISECSKILTERKKWFL
jgi:hypothetical protein